MQPRLVLGESSSSTGAESSSSDDGSEDLPCPAGEFDTTTLPATVTGTSAGEDSEFGGTCGGGGAPDIAFLFTAPFDGDFIFDTFGSSFDTVLYVLDGECGGPQLACNDDGIGTTTLSAVSVTLVEGQMVTAVVDAFGLWSFTADARIARMIYATPISSWSAARAPSGSAPETREAAPHTFTARSLSALPTTETEERLIAAAANIGESSSPTNG